MALADKENVQKDFAPATKVTALHKLYQDNGKSFSAKSTSIYHSNLEESGPILNFAQKVAS